ncbi:hypothetical protein [Chlorogloeopsis sp. ULAP02]|uniref:hypothetical protein n=1 Tax=Chlorogloeopsis sp. ULAP02 TaxID=3107926 RepID=UPI003134F1F8
MWHEINNTNWKELLETRLENLGWTLYKLAKEYIKVLGEENSPASRYHSAIGKLFEMPEKSKIKTVENVIKALDGKIIIVWDNTKKESVADGLVKLRECTTNQIIQELSRRVIEISPPELIKLKYPNCPRNKLKISSQDIASLLDDKSASKKYKAN